MLITNRQLSTFPPPLIVSEENSFAYFTFTNRLPVITRQVIEENKFNETALAESAPLATANLETLTQDIVRGTVRNLLDTYAPDTDNWLRYLKPFLGKAWIDTPFYFAEAYFYRRLLEATEYFSENSQVDPFALQKHLGLESVIVPIRNVCRTLIKRCESHQNEQQNKALLRNLVYLNLWGNRADLSLNPSTAGSSDNWNFNIDDRLSHIVIDNTSKVIEKFEGAKLKRIDFIVDNSGFELFTDLCLADRLISDDLVERVYFHLKKHPTFVSDATIEDTLFTIKYLANDECTEVRTLASRLQEYVETNRLYLTDDFFWNAPLEFWEMSESLFKDLQESDFVVIKGDANYRRLIGDRHWNFTHSFKSIVSYLPMDLVAIRTLKSEVIVGLNNEQIETLNREDSKWLVNGKWGVIQTN